MSPRRASDSEYGEIRDEALKFLRSNCGAQATCGYPSPRVSSEVPDCSMPLTFDQYSYCSLGCLYCAVAGTPIAAVGGKKSIESMAVGDMVYSYNETTSRVEEDTIVSVMERTVQDVLELTLEDGTSIQVTTEHPVFVHGKGWVDAGKLQEGDNILCIKRPDASFHMQQNNPMKNKESSTKQSRTLKKSFASGRLDRLKDKLREAGIVNLVKWNTSPEGRAVVSRRMIERNPMRRDGVAQRVSETRKSMFASGELEAFWAGKEKPDAVARMSGLGNPMKDPAIRAATLRKAVATWNANGRISEGELKVKDALSSLGESFIHQAVVEGLKRVYLLDFLLPDKAVCIEYDGHSRHFTEEGILSDKTRDAHVSEHHGIRTVRIHRDEAFLPVERLQSILAERISP